MLSLQKKFFRGTVLYTCLPVWGKWLLILKRFFAGLPQLLSTVASQSASGVKVAWTVGSCVNCRTCLTHTPQLCTKINHVIAVVVFFGLTCSLFKIVSLAHFFLFESSLWQSEDGNHSRSLEFDFGRIFRDVLQAAPTNPYYPGKVHVACGMGKQDWHDWNVLTWCFANSGCRFVGVCPVSWGIDPYGVPRPMDRSCSVTVCFWWLVFTFLRAR